MLTLLSIQNFVLIDRLEIRFEDDFSVITGETGAGKSIIMGALGLVLGQRADGKSIKDGADKCVIEATFDIKKYDLLPFFQENDLEYDSKICLFRRELYASGKSRAFVNDSPVSLSVMKELGGFLVDIHSQNQNLLLGDPLFQLNVIDLMSGNKILLQQYRAEFSIYTSQERELNLLKEKADQAKKEEDYIRFQLGQFDSARLQPGEQNELEQEQELLSHAEEIRTLLYKLHEGLNGEEQGIVRGLKDALSIVATLGRYYPNAKEMEERLRSAYLDLNDLAAEAETQQEKIEYNPERMDFVNERLNLLYSLEQKHRVSSLDELLDIYDRFKVQLREIDSFDEQIAGLEQEIEIKRVKLYDLANVLSASRKKTAEIISDKLVDLIRPLGMPNGRFQIRLTKKQQSDVNGIDDVCFLFTANKNGTLQPVSDTASGGEVSRLMLCLKAMIAGYTALPSILFDEVDTGVSGDIADKMGDIMCELGSEMQVIAITHLPQIAAKGKAHYLVYKQDFAEQTVTKIRRLDREERLKEVARMLSGAVLTDSAIANARDLLGAKS